MMLINKNDVSELAILHESEIDSSTIIDILLNQEGDTVFIIDDNNIFKGIITVGDYKRFMLEKENKLKINSKCKFIYDDKDALENLFHISSEFPNIRMIPVLDNGHKLVYAYSFPIDYTEIYYRVFSLLYEIKADYICYLNSYFLKNSYKKVIIWGTNKIALALASELNKLNVIEKIVVYDNLKNQEKNKVNNLFFDFDIIWVNSLKCIKGIINDFDLVIIADLSAKSGFDIYFEKYDYKLETIYFLSTVYSCFIIQESIKQQCSKLNKKGIHSICVSIPPNLSDLEELSLSTSQRIKRFKSVKELSYEDAEILFGSKGGKGYTLGLGECISNRPHIIKKDNILLHSNYKSKYINCINGERVTIGQPNKYDNSIYLIGSCIADSSYTEDKDTIGSCLQSMILNYRFNKTYRVVALGGAGGLYWKYNLNRLDTIKLKVNDIVIFIDGKKGIPYYYPYIDITNNFKKLYETEEFSLDSSLLHCNYKGTKVIAEAIFNKLISLDIEKEVATTKDEYIYFASNIKNHKKVFEDNKELIEYINKLKPLKFENDKTVGAIVMNCNPFTLGHQYLVEYASKEVDWLFVFIVEEDKSVFPFNLRFDLVKKGLKHIENITILPSGNFIISSKTFSEYFTKDTPDTVKIDTSTDIEVFAQHIAPALNIKKRFVGEEPFDPVTNQYNTSMKEILPDYGVEVEVIPRKEINGEVISASKVRAFLKEGNFEEIRKMVPYSTFKYLINNI